MPGQGYTKLQRQDVENLVIFCKLSRMTLAETQKAVYEKLHLTISEDWISHIRGHTKQGAMGRLKKLQQDQYEFILTYMERIDEVKAMQDHFWQEFNKINDPIERINSLKEARELTVLLTDLIEHLPIIAGVKVTSNDVTEAQRPSGTTEEDQGATSQRIFG
jgi:DNA phosphorothioation-dependent restriction protein DptG